MVHAGERESQRCDTNIAAAERGNGVDEREAGEVDGWGQGHPGPP